LITDPWEHYAGFAIQWSVAGSQTNDNPRALCATGKYKIDSGNGICTNCMSNQYSVQVGATTNTCQNCPENTIPRSDSALCICKAGWTVPNEGGPYVQCAVGKYKVEAGNSACVHCIAGKYSSGTGVQFENKCLECGVGKSTQGLDAQTTCVDCIVDKYAVMFASAECAPCIPGTYNKNVGSMRCVACVANTYSPIWEATLFSDCQNCPIGTSSPAGSTEQTHCICSAGWTRSTGSCVQCVDGKYKNVMGDAACVHCLAGTYSANLGAHSCQVCAAGKSTNGLDARSLPTDCIDCSAGTHTNDLTGRPECSQCVAGKYSSSAGTAVCTDCIAGKYSITVGDTSDVCQECPLNTDSAKGSDSETGCICKPGYRKDNDGSCSACCIDCIASNHPISTRSH